MALNTIYMFMTIQLGSPSTQHLHLGISNSVSSKRNPHTSFTPPRLPHHSCSHHFFNCWDKKPWRHSWSLSFSHALHLIYQSTPLVLSSNHSESNYLLLSPLWPYWLPWIAPAASISASRQLVSTWQHQWSFDSMCQILSLLYSKPSRMKVKSS